MVPFASYISRGQSKPRLIFSRINGPIVFLAANGVSDFAHKINQSVGSRVARTKTELMFK